MDLEGHPPADLADDQPLVMTDATVRNLRALGEAMTTARPVLVRGARGSGKSALVRALAAKCGVNLVEVSISLSS